MKIVLWYVCRQQRYSIVRVVPVNKKRIPAVLDKLMSRMKVQNFKSDKLGGFGNVVQVDKTMLNHKCKSGRGQGTTNTIDSLCVIVFLCQITRVFAGVKSNKTQATTGLLICAQLANGSLIHTDELWAYANLSSYSFTRGMCTINICLLNGETNVNTQGIESFHNELKYEIEHRKGVPTDKRHVSL